MVLYVMLAGCLPFDEDDLPTLFAKVRLCCAVRQVIHMLWLACGRLSHMSHGNGTHGRANCRPNDQHQHDRSPALVCIVPGSPAPQVMAAQYEVPPWLSPDAVALLGAMLNPDPTGR